MDKISKDDIINKAIGKFQDITDKNIPIICDDIPSLKILMSCIIEYTLAYQHIIFDNKLRLLKQKLGEDIDFIQEPVTEILCNWNPEFKREIDKVIDEIVKK